MVSPGNIPVSNVIQTECVVFICLKYTVLAIKEKKAMDLKGEYIRGFGGRKGQEGRK